MDTPSKASPTIFLIKVNDGWFLIPMNLALYLYKTKMRLENIESWGEFRKIVSPEIFQMCFKLSYDYRHGSVTYVAIPENRKKDPTYDHFTDDNLSFALELGRYLGALYKYNEVDYSEIDWIPGTIKDVFGSSIREMIYFDGFYFLEDGKRIDELCSLLYDSKIQYVFISKQNFINCYSLIPDKYKGEAWHKEFARRTKWVYKPNYSSDNWDLDSDIVQKFKLVAGEVTQYVDDNTKRKRKEYRLPEQLNPDIFFEFVEEAGYVVVDWGFSFDFGLHSILRSENEIIWMDRALALDKGYAIEYRDIPLVYHTPYYISDGEDNLYTSLLKGKIENPLPKIDPELHRLLRRFWSIQDLANNFIAEFHSHGPFAIEFFYLKGRSAIAREIIREPPSQEILRRTIAISHARDDGQTDRESERIFSLTGASNIITEYVIRLLISHLSENLNNRIFLKDWLDQACSPKVCSYCGRTFQLIHLPPWLYCGSGGMADCCFLCNITEFPRKEEIKPKIMDFINICGFIPFSTAKLSDYSFMSRINPEKKRGAVLSYAKMGRPKHVANLFGSWFEGLYNVGALPDGVMVTKRGIRCMALDKHVCLSMAEQQIDDWFTTHGVEHEREPYYPKHATLNPKELRRADWLIGDTYVEYFGLKGEEGYDQKMGEKIKLAQELNLELLSLFSSDLVNLDEILTPLFLKKKSG